MKTTHTQTLPEVAIDCRAHTPGPWMTLPTDDGWISVIANGRIVANVAPESGIDTSRAPAIAHFSLPVAANARLIAAAPELLAFARAYLDTWPAAGDEDPLAVQARAAIAKVRGGAK